MFADDATTFMADYGEAVTWSPSVAAGGGAVRSGLMLFDQPDAEIQSGDAVSREYEVTFATADWPGLRRDEVLVIGGAGGGASYKLRTKPYLKDDAVFSSAKLTKV